MNIQYVSSVTNDKDIALKLKRKVRKNKNLYLKNNCTWDELKSLILNGCTIARVGTKSEYIALDIDGSEVTHDEMKKWAESYGQEVLWTKSISGNQYKHHVYFHVDEFDVSEVEEVTNKCSTILKNAFAGKSISIDKHAWSYWQCMYNVGAKNTTFVLDGSIQLNDWCCKFKEPAPYISVVEEESEEPEEDENSDIDSYLAGNITAASIPNDAKWYKMLLKKNNISMEAYKTMPWEALSMVYVKKGLRHTAMYKVVECVVKNVIVNRFFNVNYTYEDALYTIKRHIAYHFEDGNEYFESDKTSIENAIKNKYSEYMKKYNESTAEYDSDALTEALGEGKHRYSIKSFAKKYIGGKSFTNIDDTCIEIVDEWYGYPEDYDTNEYNKVLTIVRNIVKPYFEHKKNIKIEKDLNEARRVFELTKNVQLFDDIPCSDMSFEEFCSKSTAGDTIIVENVNVTVARKEHKQHKCKYNCEGMNKEDFDKYCKENNISKVTKSRLKKKYNIQ